MHTLTLLSHSKSLWYALLVLITFAKHCVWVPKSSIHWLRTWRNVVFQQLLETKEASLLSSKALRTHSILSCRLSRTQATSQARISRLLWTVQLLNLLHRKMASGSTITASSRTVCQKTLTARNSQPTSRLHTWKSSLLNILLTLLKTVSMKTTGKTGLNLQLRLATVASW